MTINIPDILKKGVTYSVYSELLFKREVFLMGEVTEETAHSIIAQLSYLDGVSNEPITLMINSPGGSVIDGLAIYDMMQYINSPVYTLCIGEACSMASLILTGGEKGFRKALPNSTVMVHQISQDDIGGKLTDIKIQTAELHRIEMVCNEIMALHTDHPIKKILRDSKEDFYMSAQQAVTYGLIDAVIARKT
jgi:ATP-dependent Clp protease protease subunit